MSNQEKPVDKKKKGLFGTWKKKNQIEKKESIDHVEKKEPEKKEERTEQKPLFNENTNNKNTESDKKEKRRSIRFQLAQAIQDVVNKPKQNKQIEPKLKESNQNLKFSLKIDKKNFGEEEDLKKKLQTILPRNLLKEIQSLKEVELIIGNRNSKMGV
jgi:hypothetical protein